MEEILVFLFKFYILGKEPHLASWILDGFSCLIRLIFLCGVSSMRIRNQSMTSFEYYWTIYLLGSRSSTPFTRWASFEIDYTQKLIICLNLSPKISEYVIPSKKIKQKNFLFNYVIIFGSVTLSSILSLNVFLSFFFWYNKQLNFFNIHIIVNL